MSGQRRRRASVPGCSPTQIEAARDMARTKSSDVSDIGRLSPGQFYAAGEGMRFRKVRTRMCLSQQGGPLTREEWCGAARAGATTTESARPARNGWSARW